jgi:hypothetical protein
VFKKLLFFISIAVATASLAAPRAYAVDQASAYLAVRCTATISVELFDTSMGGMLGETTWYNFGDVGAVSTAVATNPIGVRNNSSGLITRWELDVSSIDNGWTLGSTPGIDRAVLYAKFSTATLTADDFDMVNDTVPCTAQAGEAAKPYSSSMNFYYAYCSQYYDPHVPDITRVLPMTYDPAPEGKAARHLWLKILTPTALENPNTVTTMMLRITAK